MSRLDSEVYTATYSGIQVFEMTINELSMMRRRSDSYLNATQILKLGGLEKGKRTKILEREILPSIHEKIQGGYGKYQGTWVPFERGRELAERYNVLELLLPLLDFDTSTWDQLPEKEQMTARLPRQPRNNYAFNAQQTHSSPPPSSPSYSSQQDTFTTTALFKRKIPPFENDENGLPNLAPLPLTTAPKKRPKKQQSNGTNDNNNGKTGINKTTVSSPARPTIISKKEDVTGSDMERQVNAMLSIFSSSDDDHIPPSLSGAGATAGLDMDVSLDDQGHTALHWSVSLARIHTVEWLISKGATVTTVNYVGETALMRGVMGTFIYDHECFPQMLDILRGSLSLVDHMGRSILHHIILASQEGKTTSNTTVTEGSVPILQPSTSTSAASPLTLSSPIIPSLKTISSSSQPISSPSSSSVLPSTPSSQSESRQLAAKLYMQNVLRTIHQHKEFAVILNKPDDSGETPYALASRLNCTDLCYLLSQSGCTIPPPLNNPSLALPPTSMKQDTGIKKPTKKRVDRKSDKKVVHSGDTTTNAPSTNVPSTNVPSTNIPSTNAPSTNAPSTKGQELVSTVQRIVEAMDLEFSSKLQTKESDVARMQQEIKDLSQQLDEGRKQWEESNKTNTNQLQQAHLKIRQLEDILGKSGVKDLDIGTNAINHITEKPRSSSTEREKQLEMQIAKIQSEAQLAIDTKQRLATMEQSYAELLVKEMGCKRLIAACCNLPLEKIDDFIEPLTLAIENDPPDMDFARVIGFMEKLRQHQQ